jgi:DNA-binding MarR family transcriptional regulator
MAEEPASPVSFGMLEHVLGFRMQRLRAALAARMLVAMKRWSLPKGSFMVLALVQANPGLGQTALVRETGIRKTLLVAVLHALEARGLVMRRALTSDHRQKQVYITDAGQTVLTDMAEAVMAIEAPLRTGLSDDTMRQMKAAFDQALAAVHADDGVRETGEA